MMSEDAPVAASPQPSFAERKTVQLNEERRHRDAIEPVTPADPIRTPNDVVESAEDVEQDDAQGLYADSNDEQLDDEEHSPTDLDEESPEGQDLDQDDSPVDWEKRYKDLQSETQVVRESRGEMEQEHAESMGQHLELRFQLEDQLTEATQRAEFFYNTLSGNAHQFKNIDWSRVPPDKVQAVQAQAQQALYLEQQAGQAYEQQQEHVAKQKEQMKQREAAIAKTRLRRSIPNWSNETYGELRQFASEVGMPAKEFNDITSPVMIEALHAYQQLRNTGSSVRKSTNRKAAAPRGQVARRQTRTAKGQFAKKAVEPNQRGSFADKHQHRLAMERQGR
jgi:hypothetical protein